MLSKQKLLDVTKQSLLKGIEQAVPGNYVGDIGNAVQTHAESNGFSVVRELVGHGIGTIFTKILKYQILAFQVEAICFMRGCALP